MARKKPKIPNVWWRDEWAWGRIQKNGRTFREPLETKDPVAARERVKKWLETLQGTKWGNKPQRSYAEAAEKFIEEHLPQLKKAADGSLGRGAKRYLQSLLVLEPHFDGMMLDDISSAALSEFEQKRRRGGVTNGTIRNDLWCLSSIFTRAEEWEWIKGNPVAAYIRARSKRGLLPPSDPHTRYCSHDEERELLRRCRSFKGRQDGGEAIDHVMLAAGITLTIDIGLRKEELLEADWTMVNLNREEWNVPAHLAKSGKPRTIPILPRSLKLLKALPRSNLCKYILWHEVVRNTALGEREVTHDRYTSLLNQLQDLASGGRTYVFRREASKLAAKGLKLTDARRADITALAEQEAWADAIPHLIWHDLRRTCGCRLLQDHKMSMEEVSKWLGHSSVKVTEKAYAFLEVRHLHDAVGTGARGVESRHVPLLEVNELAGQKRTKDVTQNAGE